jgi:ATP-binding cassette subfamily B protein
MLGSRARLRAFWESVQNKINKTELKTERKIATLDLVENSTREGVGLASKVWAIVLVSKGILGFEQFLFTIGLIDQAITATWRVSYEFRSLHEGIIAGQAGLELLDLNPLRGNGKTAIPNTDKMGLKVSLFDVDFAYPNSEKILNKVSISINAGEHVAIVGENGAGKSTLLKTILGQYAPQNGTVYINDRQIGEYDMSSLYESSSVLVQNYSLFSFLTIRENIQIVNPKKLSEADMLEALELAGIKDTVLKLPHGLDTRLDPTFEDGTELSGGQKQRLAIARSFAKDAKLLILDEPTSAIDAKAEKRIFDTIFARHSNATVIIVSHRFSTVKKANKIIVVENGTITEQGTHTELLELNGHYAELYKIQASEYSD